MTDVEAPYYYPRYLAAPSRFPTAGIVWLTVGGLIVFSFIVFVAWWKCKAKDHNAGQQDADPQQEVALPIVEQEVFSEGSSAPANELDDGLAGAASFSITASAAVAA